MLICHLIFRFDFNIINFKIIDKPGQIMEILWDSFLESGIDKKR